MTPEAIRTETARCVDLFPVPGFESMLIGLLGELTAQVAEMNQKTRKTAKKAPATMKSVARKSSASKRFHVLHWGSAVEKEFLPEFTPNKGQKHWDDLALEETTKGKLGTVEDAVIRRVM